MWRGLLLLLPHDPRPGSKPRWKLGAGVLDVGLEIGHSVRTIDACMAEAAADITVKPICWEARFFCGAATPCSYEFESAFQARFEAQHFFDGKSPSNARAMPVRRQRLQARTQPEDSPGGLRDLHTIHGWRRRVTSAAAGMASPARAC